MQEGKVTLPYEFLVVDDSAVMRQTVTDFAEDLSHVVTAVDSGGKALDVVRERTFDLVFLDVYMPVMDGLETFRRIREIRSGQKIVLMTSDRDEELFDKVLAPAMRCSGFINKPFDANVFKDCVKTVLELKGTFSHKKEGL